MSHDQGPILDVGAEVAPGYQVIAHISRGKRLDVYDVWSVDRACRCVAKTITPDRLGETRARDKLCAEGKLLLRLSHPNIVRAYEILTGAETGAPVLILETLTGRTLTHLIDEFSDGLELEDVAWLGLHLCSAVAYLHRHDHLHLDVKPDNVICESGRARLIDLSIAGPPGTSAVGAGTYDYLAPEQARGEPVSAATDVWGIGITLYEALTGTVPFEPDDEGDDGFESVTGYTDASGDNNPADYPQSTERAPSVAARRDLPSDLAAAIDACLEPSSDARPSLASLARTLREASGIDPRESSIEL